MAQKYQVVITPQAEVSLESLINFLLETATDEIAERIRSGIIAEIKGLSEMPHRHGLLKGVEDTVISYRRILKWSYRIIFFIEEEDSLVFVVEIDHSKRNPEELKNVLI